jgi:hypothetical protein
VIVSNGLVKGIFAGVTCAPVLNDNGSTNFPSHGRSIMPVHQWMACGISLVGLLLLGRTIVLGARVRRLVRRASVQSRAISDVLKRQVQLCRSASVG